MEPEESLDNVRTKEVAVLARTKMQSVGQKRKQRTAQPFMRWDIEAGLWPIVSRTVDRRRSIPEM